MQSSVEEVRTTYDQLFIGGRFVSPAGGLQGVISPATEDTFGHAAVGGIEDAEHALACARRAFDEGPWPSTDRAVRTGLSNYRSTIGGT